MTTTGARTAHNVGVARHDKIPDGPECDTCGGTETTCARRDGCCRDCSHWAGFDANGEFLHGNTQREAS